MKHLRTLQLESKTLEVFEIEAQLTAYCKQHGVTASVNKHDNHFDVFISEYAVPEERKDGFEKGLLSLFKKIACADATVIKTKYGFNLVMGQPDEAETKKLMESADEEYTCCICNERFTGWGNNPWPVVVDPEARCCNECNMDFVIPARIEQLKNSRNRKTEAIEKPEVKKATSNVVLDNKFIWLFSVMDEAGNDIEEGISELQEAIDILVNENGTFLVALPYVDPNPEDANVELVFADNPGPVMIYNKEEATHEKPDAQEEQE